MIVARLIEPASKLATARLLDAETATSSLGQALGLGAVDEQQLYGALDWLVEQLERIEKALARRHRKNGTLVLYDVSSTYFEGRTCELARCCRSGSCRTYRQHLMSCPRTPAPMAF
jgi:hypothetical protein